ncbi:hypothetical protein RO3G_09585 [Rhizopus delemar RA 99-880]|uniref:Uncharacterized protein n=1 Tax=Rhizopus delemar (strain RA 99-880 / ATCC MYA-4621 / FGSC 9543 / NRRL 43880) TaxID=246409 RepID=I1C8U5_RHIO9|nr:hypothetical protein RO3G_09585 [Rhizopus delemar RA 99-880]|eukprot:EIE84875.1 hypothetical protein RO3G_09585 [Rhizopus delemar RA 99-880]
MAARTCVDDLWKGSVHYRLKHFFLMAFRLFFHQNLNVCTAQTFAQKNIEVEVKA